MKTNLVKFLEWAQMITGCTAAAIVSFNIGDGWVFFAMCLFVIKDSMMGLFAYIRNYPGIIASSAIYVPIDIIGVIRWWPW
jgi:uncharacterized membrane protein